VAAGIDGPTQERAFDELDNDIDNLRAAWTWIERHGDTMADLGARLLQSQRRMWLYWREQGRIFEGQQRIQALLDAVPAPPAARAAALNALGLLATMRNDTDRAQSLHEQALIIARREANQLEEIQALYGLGRAVSGRDDRAALPFFEEALVVARIVGDPQSLAGVLLDLGSSRFELGDAEQAKAMFIEVLHVSHQAGDATGHAVALVNLADIAIRHDHDLVAADAFTRQSLDAWRAQGGRRLRFASVLLDSFARIALAGGFLPRAVRLMGATAVIREMISLPFEGPYEAMHEQQLTETRQALGNDAWERAWREGRAMSLEQALAYATEPLGSDTAEPPAPTGAGLLSPRELDVLRLVADGKSNQEIAGALYISPHTVATHVQNIFSKLGLESRTAVATWAVRNGLV
jgi:non-specific serine/threonine protein kinase